MCVRIAPRLLSTDFIGLGEEVLVDAHAIETIRVAADSAARDGDWRS